MKTVFQGVAAAQLMRLILEQEVAGSNPEITTTRLHGSGS